VNAAKIDQIKSKIIKKGSGLNNLGFIEFNNKLENIYTGAALKRRRETCLELIQPVYSGQFKFAEGRKVIITNKFNFVNIENPF
jgi:hypothetical protein